MTKIPVLDTIRAAYRFTFTHLGAIIGLIWLPMILATVIGFFVLQRFFSALADALASNNFALAGPAILGLISFLLVGLLLFAMMAVPVVQLALGSRKSGALAHFAFGMAEWRLFRASLGVMGFLFALLLIVSTILGAALGPRSNYANLGALFIFYAAGIFFGLRLASCCLVRRSRRRVRCCPEAGFSPTGISGASWRSSWPWRCQCAF